MLLNNLANEYYWKLSKQQKSNLFNSLNGNKFSLIFKLDWNIIIFK